MEAIFRIELKTKGYKALVLPLNYTAKLVSRGFEPLSAYSLRSNAGLLTTWVSTGNHGPGNGNRTRVFCLEGRHSTIKLHREIQDTIFNFFGALPAELLPYMAGEIGLEPMTSGLTG